MINNITPEVQDEDFETMMQRRLEANFGAPQQSGVEITDERLKEMNKKLPEWSLEPPYSFLR